MIPRIYLTCLSIVIALPMINFGNTQAFSSQNDTYIRAIIPEMLFTERTSLVSPQAFVFENNIHYNKVDNYWNSDGEDYETHAPYMTFANYLGIRYGVHRNVEIDARLALYWQSACYDWSSTNRIRENNIGDLVLSAKINPFRRSIEDERYALIIGAKIPTGGNQSYFKSSFDSHDFFIMGCYELLFTHIGASSNIGYAKAYPKNNDKSNDPGDVFFFKFELYETFNNRRARCMLAFRGYGVSKTYSPSMTKYSIGPRMEYLIPRTNVELGLGALFDLDGKSTLHGTTLLFQLNVCSDGIARGR